MNTTKTVPYVIKSSGSITMYLNGENVTIERDHANYPRIVDALKVKDFDALPKLVSVVKNIERFCQGKVRIDNGVVYYGDFPLHSTLTNRIVQMMKDGFAFDHMVKFLENLMLNPSKRAVEELYTFLENYGLPITEDGYFLAYKAVSNNYRDHHTGELDNSVGKTVSMPRNMVDEDWGKDCSQGLHVGALEYVVQFGSFIKGQKPSPGGNRLLIAKVNPKDVVSVPNYASFTKMRVCEYTILSEVTDVVTELDKIVYKANGDEMPVDANKADDGCHGGRCGCQCEDCDHESDYDSEEDDYATGFKIGEWDRRHGYSYQQSLDIDASDALKDGYSDGFNNN